MARVRFVSGGSEANETALHLARLYHVERGRSERWRVISPAQSYHGSTMGTLALSGRRAIQEPYTPYLASHLHLAPSTWRFDPSGAMALQELDRLLDEAGPETVAAFFCEPVSAAALPGYSPPELFWLGLEERRREHGFLICFDEVVSGMGRVGSWLAAHQLPIQPDIVAIGKGLGAGYAPLGAVLCTQQVYDAIDRRLAGVRPRSHVGRRTTPYGRRPRRPRHPGRAWLGRARGGAGTQPAGRARGERSRAPRSCERSEAGGSSSASSSSIRATENRFFRSSWTWPRLVDDTAFDHGLLVTSTHPQADGYAGDQTLLAPAYVSTDEELAEMIGRFATTIEHVERQIKDRLSGSPNGQASP